VLDLQLPLVLGQTIFAHLPNLDLPALARLPAFESLLYPGLLLSLGIIRSILPVYLLVNLYPNPYRLENLCPKRPEQSRRISVNGSRDCLGLLLPMVLGVPLGLPSIPLPVYLIGDDLLLIDVLRLVVEREALRIAWKGWSRIQVLSPSRPDIQIHNLSLGQHDSIPVESIQLLIQNYIELSNDSNYIVGPRMRGELKSEELLKVQVFIYPPRPFLCPLPLGKFLFGDLHCRGSLY